MPDLPRLDNPKCPISFFNETMLGHRCRECSVRGRRSWKSYAWELAGKVVG